MQDVREQDEYDVSHLPNAIRVKPDEPVDQVMTKIKQCLESKLRWLAPLVEVSESDQNRTKFYVFGSDCILFENTTL